MNALVSAITEASRVHSWDGDAMPPDREPWEPLPLFVWSRNGAYSHIPRSGRVREPHDGWRGDYTHSVDAWCGQLIHQPGHSDTPNDDRPVCATCSGRVLALVNDGIEYRPRHQWRLNTQCRGLDCDGVCLWCGHLWPTWKRGLHRSARTTPSVSCLWHGWRRLWVDGQTVCCDTWVTGGEWCPWSLPIEVARDLATEEEHR